MQRIAPSRPNSFTGGSLDRAAHLRTDAVWIEAARADQRSRYVLFRNGQPLLEEIDGVPRAVLAGRPPADLPWVFLGLQDGVPVFAAELPADEAATPGAFRDLRGIGHSLTPDDGTILATGRAMLHWRAHNRFCAICGGRNAARRGGYVLQCDSCGTEHFPRSDPAVIMLVTRGERALLGQSLRFPVDRNWYSTLAGFVEPGESLEDAVRREVFEEVGVRVGAVDYHSSQPWPFPASLMFGYYAEALSEDIVLQTAEMRDARWFSRDDIGNFDALGFALPPPGSIARLLIEDWMAEAAGQD